MNKTEKTFADGFSFKMNPNSPEWVVGGLSIKADQAIEFINRHSDKGWVNLKINIGKSGKPYVELDTWKPETKTKTVALESSATEHLSSSDGLPF